MSEEKPARADVVSRFRNVLFPSVATYYEEALVLDEGSGMRVRDVNGREYLDFFGGILTLSLGHCHERVNEAARAQMRRLGHVSTLYPTLPVVELAEKLARLAPGALDRVFFCTSGTEANETAIALAQAHTGTTEVIALRHGYSGRSLLAQSLVGSSKYRAVPSQVPGVKHAHAPYCYRCPFGLTYPACELRCARDIEDLIQTSTCGSVAAIVIEPVQGVGGFITPPPGWIEVAVEIVRRYGGLFVCDEVQTGFGRTGSMWGVDGAGAVPDVMTTAKGIANGFPISAVMASGDVAASWTAGNISTFGGNPVCCAAASATLDVIQDEGLVENAGRTGALLRAGLEALKARFSIVGDVRGRGLMQGVEIVRDEAQGDRRPDPEATARVFEAAKERGLLVGRGGLHGNVLRVAPPLIVTERDVDDALRILGEALSAACGGR